MTSNRRSPKRHGEYHRDDERQTLEERQKEHIRDTVEEANRALARGQYPEAGRVLIGLIRQIHRIEGVKSLAWYHQRLKNNDDYPWYSYHFQRFRDTPEKYIREAGQERDNAMSELGTLAARTSSLSDAPRTVIENALETAESIVAYHEVTSNGMAAEADAMGFNVKLGVHQQRYEMDFGDPVKAVTDEVGVLKSFFTGGTGGGKSSGASQQMWDYYVSTLRGGKKFKIIDPIGLNTENVNSYDIPQKQNPLRHVRENHGVPVDYTEMDGDAPELEIYVPLAPGVEDYPLPFDTEREEFVPKPFTIPASEIEPGLLIRVINERISSKDKQEIRRAYRTVATSKDDWALVDLAEEISTREELTEKQRKSAIRVIETLQEEGVIRTKECDHAIDWGDVFYSPEEVTVFNQSVCSSKLTRYLVIAHILDRVWTLRYRPNGYPSLAIWLRELWEIAPHEGRRRQWDDAVVSVTEWIIQRLTAILRKPRDINTHVVADTQNPTDVERSVREMFNRYVLFGGPERVVKDVFNWAGQGKGYKSYLNTRQGKSGVAGIIGAVDPAVSDSRKWGISPVHLTPPPWNHHDKDKGPSGWQERAKYREHEELRTPGWDIGTPADLRVDVEIQTEEQEDDVDEEEDSLKLQISNHRLEARERYKNNPDTSLRKVAAAIPDNPELEESYRASTIKRWTDDLEKGQAVKQQSDGSALEAAESD